MARLWGLGYLVFALLAAALRRRAFFQGALLCLALCAAGSLAAFFALASVPFG